MPVLLLSACFYGAWAFFNKKAVTTLHPALLQFITAFYCFCFMPLYFWLYKSSGQVSTVTSKGMTWAFLAQACASIATLLLFYYMEKRSDVGTATAISGAYPIITLCLSVVFLGEALTSSKLLGMFLIVFGVVVLGK